MTKGGMTGTKVPLDGESLRGLWLLDRMDGHARTQFLSRASVRSFRAGEALYRAGTEVRALLIVTGGHVRVVREHPQKTIVIHDERRGGCLGEVPLFEGTTYPATAIASEPTTCLVIPREVVLVAVREQPDLAIALLQRLAARVRILVDRIDSNGTRTVNSRLAQLLVERSGSTRGKVFTIGVTQQQAAEEIGTVRELVVRGLRELRDRSVIEAKGNGRYLVRDMDALRRIAHT